MQTKTKPTELLIETAEIKKANLPFRALNHDQRMKMLQLIHKKGSITVTDIYQQMRIEQSVASGFLAMLRKEGFVKATKQKRFVYYSINYHRINQLQTLSAQLLEIKGQSLQQQHTPGVEPPWLTALRKKMEQKGM